MIKLRVHFFHFRYLFAISLFYDLPTFILYTYSIFNNQVLSTRKRKLEEGEEEKVKVVLQAFDILSVNGLSLLPISLRRRRQLLRTCFKETEGLFEFAKGGDHVENGDTAPIEALMQVINAIYRYLLLSTLILYLFYKDACGAMCEGLMVKTLDMNASYEPSKRSLNWLKLKKDYIDGMGVCDSVDLVVIGGYKGRGKRVNVYGAYLMACYDPDRDEFQVK
jgi:DNA ligase-1